MIKKISSNQVPLRLDESKTKIELSCRGINCILVYIEESFGKEALEELINKTGMSFDYLRDQNNWVSWSYYCDFLEALVEWTGDSAAPYKAGTYAGCKKTWGTLHYIFYAFGNPGKVIKKGVEILPHFNKVSEWTLLSLHKNRCTFSTRMKEGYQVKRFCCESRMGQLAGIAKAFGMPMGKVREIQCQALGADSCIYEVTWLNRPQRLYGLLGLFLGILNGFVFKSRFLW